MRFSDDLGQTLSTQNTVQMDAEGWGRKLLLTPSAEPLKSRLRVL